MSSSIRSKRDRIRSSCSLSVISLVLFMGGLWSGCTAERESRSPSQMCADGQCELECESGYIEREGQCVVDVDQDADQDRVPDALDNCPLTANVRQLDCDRDGAGDACDDESLCGISMSGYVSLYDLELGADRALSDALLEVEGYPLYTVTDEGGQYQIQNLEPGRYDLLVFTTDQTTGEDHSRLLARLPFTVDPLPVGEVFTQDFVINPPGDLVGSVSFADQPQFEAVHGGIGVYLEGVPFQTAVTDMRGRFELRGVPAGEQTLKFVYPDYRSVELEVNVLSLSSVEVGSQGDLQLSVNPNVTSWTHEVTVEVTELSPMSELTFEVEMTPVFPHLSDPVRVRFTGMSDADGTLTLTQQRSHLPHEVFNITVSEELKRANRYLLDQPSSMNTRETDLFTESIPEQWLDFSERLAERNISMDQAPTTPQSLMSPDYEPAPYGTTNERGDIWTILAITSASDSAEQIDASLRLAPVRYPLAHKFGELALATTHSLLLKTPEETPEAETPYQIRFSYQTSAWGRSLKLMASPHPCPPIPKFYNSVNAIEVLNVAVQECDLIDPPSLRERCRELRSQWAACELQTVEVDLNTCDQSAPGAFECSVDINLSSAHEELRLWIVNDLITEDYDTLHTGCQLQCFNTFREPLSREATYVPIYSLVYRDLTRQDTCEPIMIREVQDTDEVYRLNTETTPLPEACFPQLPPSDLDTGLDACISQPARSASGRHLILTGFELLSSDAGVVPNLFNTQVHLNTYVDFNELNPLIRYSAGVSCLGDRCPLPLFVRYRVSDGIGIINREEKLYLSHLDNGDQPYQGDEPYCWSFTETAP